ncbi:hypothetical protein Btru_073458 [Bulinus truncatus]|nr:hypothetical protein Btru_073458 [Bulinus truncatus]
MAFQSALIFWISLLTGINQVAGHGRLLEPPSRASMWRLGFKTLPNYDDNQLFCGGVQIQYEVNGGKCGVCGDPWNKFRDHEAGGKYATGTLVRKYQTGGIMDVVVELTANHKGYFQFRLCPTDDPMANITQQCLDRHLLVNASNGANTFGVPDGDYLSTLRLPYRLRLPAGVKCRSCMLQWKYNAGNSWGTFANGTSCIGCGNQEQFYGCSDIAIGYDDVELGVSNNFTYPTVGPSGSPDVVNNDDDTGNQDNNCAYYFYGYCISSSSSFRENVLLLIVTFVVSSLLKR